MHVLRCDLEICGERRDIWPLADFFDMPVDLPSKQIQTLKALCRFLEENIFGR